MFQNKIYENKNINRFSQMGITAQNFNCEQKKINSKINKEQEPSFFEDNKIPILVTAGIILAGVSVYALSHKGCPLKKTGTKIPENTKPHVNNKGEENFSNVGSKSTDLSKGTDDIPSAGAFSKYFSNGALKQLSDDEVLKVYNETVREMKNKIISHYEGLGMTAEAGEIRDINFTLRLEEGRIIGKNKDILDKYYKIIRLGNYDRAQTIGRGDSLFSIPPNGQNSAFPHVKMSDSGDAYNPWIYHIPNSYKGTGSDITPACRMSLNVKMDEELVSELGKYLDTHNIQAKFKYPPSAEKCCKRHDTITIYFDENPSDAVQEAITKIANAVDSNGNKKFIRDEWNLIGKKLGSGVAIEREP